MFKPFPVHLWTVSLMLNNERGLWCARAALVLYQYYYGDTELAKAKLVRAA